jgi:hypothetical protein
MHARLLACMFHYEKASVLALIKLLNRKGFKLKETIEKRR